MSLDSDLTSLQWESKFQLLLAQVQQTNNKDDLAVKALNKAFETQSRWGQPSFFISKKHYIAKLEGIKIGAD